MTHMPFCRLRRFATAALAIAAVWSAIPPLRAQITAPTVAFLSPQTASAGDPDLTMTVTGGGFITGSTVLWGGQPLATTYVSINQLVARVPAANLATPGQVGVSVINGGLRSNTVAFTINAPPISISTTTLPAGTVGTTYSATLAAVGGTAPYAWSATGALPPGLTLSGAGVLSGVPTSEGTFNFTLQIVDAAQRTATRTLSLTIAPAPLSISTTTLPPAVEGVEYTQTFAAVSANPPLRWSVGAGLPPGLALDATTGVLRGVPTTRGSYSFTVQVTDRLNTSATRALTLVVQPPPLAITTISPLFTGTVGVPYSQTFSATGGSSPYTWTLTSGSVSGLTLDRASGVLAGTPDQAGQYNISVQVTDAAGATVSRSFALSVETPQLRITNSSPLTQASVGVGYQYRFLATGGRAPYSWSVISGSVPGLELDSTSGVFSGTPTLAGTHNITVAVRDAGGSTAQRAFAITVLAGALRLTPLSETLQVTAGESFSAAIGVSGGTPPYVWSVNGLPEGVEMDSEGVISGSPRVPGTYLFTVRVTDALRATATELYRLDVIAPNVPAVVVDGLPDQAKAADQAAFRVRLASTYSLPLTGQLTISFVPEAGTSDPAVQFSTGGRTLDFRIPAGSTEAELPASSVGLQTGTVAGTINLMLRLNTPGANLTPTPITVKTIRIDRVAPVITSSSFTRSGSNIEIRITGYSTSRELTQAVFRFSAAGGSTLSASDITVPVADLFASWYRSTESNAYGGQFTFTQQFAIQGDVNAVTPVSVSLTNRTGSTTANIR